MPPKSLRYPPTRIKPATPAVDLALKIGTALLMTFAATLVLVQAEVYLARLPTMF
jgi:hypothetical protein